MVGQTIGKYTIKERVGRGGMGTVYRALDATLDRDVAIKVLNPELSDPDIARRFRAEAVIAARLNHPGIATVYELFQHGDEWLLVMEYVRGETLEHLIDRFGPMAPERAGALVAQALSALDYAHGMHIVHRDLKPANLMVTDKGAVKIMDFGIAHVAGSDRLTSAGLTMGTPAYMAPEQVLGQDVDERTDLYAMGLVFYRLVTGHLAFRGKTPFAIAQSQVQDPPTPARVARVGLPAWVEPLLDRALAKSPDDRFQSAEEFRSYVSDQVAGMTSTASQPTDETMLPAAVSVKSGPVSATGGSGATRVTPGATPATPTPVVPIPTQGTVVFRTRHLVMSVVAAVVLVAAAGAVILMRGYWPAPTPTAAPAPDTPPAVAAPAAETRTKPKSAIVAPKTKNLSTIVGAPTESAAAKPAPEPAHPSPVPPSAMVSGPPPAPTSPPAPISVAVPIVPVGPPIVQGPPRGGRGRAGLDATNGPPPAGGRGDARVVFPDIRCLVVAGTQAHWEDAVLRLAANQVLVVSQKDDSKLSSLPYRAISRATYNFGPAPRFAPNFSAPGPEVTLPVPTPPRPGNWLTLQTPTEYLVLEMSDLNWKRVVDAVEEYAGVTVARLTPTKPQQKSN